MIAKRLREAAKRKAERHADWLEFCAKSDEQIDAELREDWLHRPMDSILACHADMSVDLSMAEADEWLMEVLAVRKQGGVLA